MLEKQLVSDVCFFHHIAPFCANLREKHAVTVGRSVVLFTAHLHAKVKYMAAGIVVAFLFFLFWRRRDPKPAPGVWLRAWMWITANALAGPCLASAATRKSVSTPCAIEHSHVRGAKIANSLAKPVAAPGFRDRLGHETLVQLFSAKIGKFAATAAKTEGGCGFDELAHFHLVIEPVASKAAAGGHDDPIDPAGLLLMHAVHISDVVGEFEEV